MKEHIVILGGGFGGWYAARALAPRLRAGHTVTLVDRADHMLYTPMLTEVAGGNLPASSIAVSMKELPRRVRVVQSTITAIDAKNKTVTLAEGEVLQATHLVVALGATTAYHHIAGAEEHTLPLKTLADATRVLARVDAMVNEAANCGDAQRRQEMLTLVVAGGGYTGVETMAAVHAHLTERATMRGISAKEIHAVLIEPTGRVMRETVKSLALYSQHHLERTGVHVRLDVGVESVSAGAVKLTNGEEIKAGLLLWDTGIVPNPLLRATDLPLSKHHAVTVDACFRVQGLENVWAIGDCAEIPQKNGKPYAQTAQNATREGAHLAQNISAVIRGDAARPFRFTMLGQLALLSERTAVAEVLGVKLWGSLAWLLWWAVYTAKLPSLRGRVAVLRALAR